MLKRRVYRLYQGYAEQKHVYHTCMVDFQDHAHKKWDII